MRRHKLNGEATPEKFLEWYQAEMKSVTELALDEVQGEELKRVLKEETVIPMRFNPENKGGGLWKFRWLVRGDMEPKAWRDGVATDSPTMMAASARMLIAMGVKSEADLKDDELSTGDINKAFLKGEEYKPQLRRRARSKQFVGS